MNIYNYADKLKNIIYFYYKILTKKKYKAARRILGTNVDYIDGKYLCL